MRHKPTLALMAGMATLFGSFWSTAVSANADESHGWNLRTVVSGLALPRGIAVDGDKALYVAESGLPGPGTEGLTSGSVDKFTLGAHPSQVWSTPFTSAYQGDGTDYDVIGPTGLNLQGEDCGKHEEGGRCNLSVVMGLSRQEIPFGQFGRLYSLDSATGAKTLRSDAGGQDYDWAAAHSYLWNEFPDANPYGVVTTRGKGRSAGQTYVIDAGANTVTAIAPDGTATVIAYIPNEQPVSGLETRDSTPTCAAQGPDGALYIGTLDLVRNFQDPHQGWSHVYRVDPSANEDYLSAAHVWASGLTTVTGCAFDSDGNFWAAEMFKHNAAGPPGDLVRIPFKHPTQLEHVGGGALPFPGGVAAADDNVYVATFSAGTNHADGAVVRVNQN